MVQDDSIIELLKTLCRHYSYGWKTGFQDEQILYRKSYSILLKLNSATCFSSSVQKNLLQYLDTDYIHAEIFNLQLLNRTAKSQKLSVMIQNLEDQDGNLSDDIASCLKFLFCLSKFTATDKYEDVFQCHSDSFQQNDVNLDNVKFHYKCYPSTLFETCHYPSLETNKYYSELFATVQDGTDNGFHKKIFSQALKTSSAYDCFGAFCTSRKSNLNTKLELPLLTESQLDRPTFYNFQNAESSCSDTAENIFEDKGFVDLDVNQKPLNYDDTEIWEKVSRLKSKRFLSWEEKTGYTDAKEKCFLSGSGPESVHVIRLSHQQNLTLLDPTMQPSVVKTYTAQQLLRDCTRLLLAVESNTFQYDKSTKSFVLQFEVQIPGLTPESIQHFLRDMLECGTSCKRIEIFSAITDAKRNGHILSSFKDALRLYLQYYRGTVLYIAENHGHSLMRLHAFMSGIMKQIRFISEMCYLRENKSNLPTGLRLVDYIYQQCVDQWGGDSYLVLLFLLKSTIIPYVRFLQEWLFEGVCNDLFGEFNIKVNEQYVSSRNEKFWSKAYIPSTSKAASPFLNDTSTIVTCGKALNMLRICCPQHCLLNEQEKRPKLCFSLCKKNLQKVSDENKEYVKNMMNIFELQQRIRKAMKERKKLEERKHLLEARLLATSRYRLQREFQKEMIEKQKKKQHELCNDLNRQIQERKLLNDAAKSAEDAKQHADDIGHIELQIKGDIENQYANLLKDANVQQQKFEWQVKRFQLHEKRQLFYRSEEESLSKMRLTISEISEQNEIGDNSNKYVNSASLCAIGSQQLDIPSEGRIENDILGAATNDRNTNLAVSNSCTETTPLQVSEDNDVEFLRLLFLEDEKFIEERNDNVIQDKDEDADNDVPELESKPADIESTVNGDEIRDTLKSEKVGNFNKPKPYKVNYDELTAAPTQDFLKHLPKISELFTSFGCDQEDADFLQQIPLSILLNKSFYPAIHAQAKLVNKAVLDYFIDDLNILDHFGALRNYFFFQDGEFGQTLSQLLFQKMQMGRQSGTFDIFSPFTLSAILSESLSASINGENELSENLSFMLISHPYPSTFSDFEFLENLRLMYRVDWPLNVVITESSMASYNKVWRFLLYIKHLLWTLMSSWHNMKQSGQCLHIPLTWQYRRLQIYRHEMQHFVRSIQNFVVCEKLQMSWIEFEKKVTQKVATVDDLIDAHKEYVISTCKGCLLTEEANDVMKLIRYMLETVLKFHLQISNLSSKWNSNECVFEELCELYDNFKTCSKQLQTSLRAYVTKRPKDSIAYLLTMLET